MHPDDRMALERALNITPDDAEYWYLLWSAGKHASDPDHEFICRALELNPTLLDARVSRGNAFLALRRFEEALREFRAALASNPHQSALLHCVVGNVLAILGRDDEAIEYYLGAIYQDSAYGITYLKLAGAYVAHGDLERGRAYFEQAVALEPSFADMLQLDPRLQPLLGPPDESA